MTGYLMPRLPGPARCAESDPEAFYPEKGERAWNALAVCAACDPDVRQACLAYALTHREPGIWGGTTENERRRMGRRAA